MKRRQIEPIRRGTRRETRLVCRGAIAAALALALALFAVVEAPAATKAVTVTGPGAEDKAVEFEMEIEGKTKKGVPRLTSISSVVMRNAEFVCKPTGNPSGRSDYSTFYEDVLISKKGKFVGVNENKASGYVLSRYTLKGKAEAKGKTLILEGSFHAELSEGGLNFSNCDTGKVPFRLKAKL